MEQEYKHQGAKNFFLYFLLFALLYLVAINFGGLLFDLIDKAFPVSGNFWRGKFNQGSLRFHLSAMIIATPVFLYMARKMYRDAEKSIELKTSALRRWLTYITLLVTTLIVVGDLIGLVYNLLGGETTARFILKALVVLFIAAVVLYYYIQDIKRLKKGNEAITIPLQKIYFMGSSLLILVTIIVGLFMIESPAEQRLKNNDNERIENLQTLQFSIENYAVVHSSLPVSLDDIPLPTDAKNDPITDELYVYEPISDTNYKLCATFEASNLDNDDEDEFARYPVAYPGQSSWLHKPGDVCFERSISAVLRANQDIDAKPLAPIPAERF